MSGLLLISICRKLTIPAISKALNTTSGKTGLRIDQAEILRKSTSVFLQALTSGLLKMRPDLLPWIEESPSGGSEEHTSELQSLMRISYAVFCLKKKKSNNKKTVQVTYNTKVVVH